MESRAMHVKLETTPTACQRRSSTLASRNSVFPPSGIGPHGRYACDEYALNGPPPLVERVADFRGVASPVLRDSAALAGLALSAAGAAGLSTLESPIVRALPRDGLALILFLDLGHIAVHTLPERETVVLNLLVAAGRDPQMAVDVFARKFGVSETLPARAFDRG
ncbi:MAG: hypothetical protein CK531_05860 [Gemmatimonadetes bacterium]|nr:MAG: hypothetical protein CK531_05860 [Gemmatimonadota bacterium]